MIFSREFVYFAVLFLFSVFVMFKAIKFCRVGRKVGGFVAFGILLMVKAFFVMRGVPGMYWMVVDLLFLCLYLYFVKILWGELK